MIPPSSETNPTPAGTPRPRTERMGSPFLANGRLCEEVFEEISRIYHERCGYHLICADADGNLVYGLPECLRFPCRLSCQACRKETLERSLEGGLPAVCSCADDFALWGVPLMLNQNVQGGLIVAGVPLTATANRPAVPFAEACQTLLSLAVEFNLTNRDYLKTRRDQFQGPRSDPSTPHSVATTFSFRSLRPLLEASEEALSRAILHEDTAAAEAALDRISNALLSVPDLSRPILQGYAMHLLNVMHEHATSASGRYSLVLEHSYMWAARLIAQEDPAGVCHELESGLATLMDLIRRNQKPRSLGHFARALGFIESHFHEPLTRADVAREAGVSESQLSRLLRQKTGHSFTEIISRCRIDRAAQLLLRSDQNILSIAMEVGFSDQSYFGRVFRRYYGQTPDEFRQSHK